MTFTEYEMRVLILKCLDRIKHDHRANILGRGRGQGLLESYAGATFTPEDRALAGRCLIWLESQGLVAPTYNDTTDPTNWLALTERGRVAAASGAIDRLDELLSCVNIELVARRHGAWATFHSKGPDSLEQAAHSMRELLRGVLDSLAPKDEVTAAIRCPDGKVTRAQRVRFVLEKRGRPSRSTAEIIETSCTLIDKLYDRLSGVAHHGNLDAIEGQVRRLLITAEQTIEELLDSIE